MFEPWRGPHQDREWKLMVFAEKPAAVLSQWEFEKPVWKAAIASGQWLMASCYAGGFRRHQHNRLYIVATSEARLRRLVTEFTSVGRDHWRIGLLLGYKVEHVREFCNRLGRYSDRRYDRREAA